MDLNPLPRLMRLVFRRFINEDPRAAFVLLERVTARDGAAPDPAELSVADRVYKDLCAAALREGRQGSRCAS
jgi:hypothetical protein